MDQIAKWLHRLWQRITNLVWRLNERGYPEPAPRLFPDRWEWNNGYYRIVRYAEGVNVREAPEVEYRSRPVEWIYDKYTCDAPHPVYGKDVRCELPHGHKGKHKIKSFLFNEEWEEKKKDDEKYPSPKDIWPNGEGYFNTVWGARPFPHTLVAENDGFVRGLEEWRLANEGLDYERIAREILHGND